MGSRRACLAHPGHQGNYWGGGGGGGVKYPTLKHLRNFFPVFSEATRSVSAAEVIADVMVRECMWRRAMAIGRQ
ncbi:hypothetical protein Ga0100231_010035 [Opitutaceae bacterium TAV4]|nr:hypothetical protein Ga0100231_010035 [Opitutaceae bacterium TAV4]